MRAQRLRSPHRQPQGTPNEHEGYGTTAAPERLWGTDGIRIETAAEGWVWVLSAAHHCQGQCVGWHPVKIGDRLATLEPIAQAFTERFGRAGAQAGRGLALRLDQATQYLSVHFLSQLELWGITASPAFVAEPQTNALAERFTHTLKEQAIHRRIFRNLEDVMRSVGEFVERYKTHWQFKTSLPVAPGSPPGSCAAHGCLT